MNKGNKKKDGRIPPFVVLIVAIVVSAVYIYLKSSYSLPPIHISSDTDNKVSELYGLYSVVRVVDGDTIIIDIDGEETRVRLIGVDTPESVNPDVSLNTENGRIASEWTKELLTDNQVYLEYDRERTDKYGRTLAYVFLSDKETMVQSELLRNGLAEVMTIEPNSKYSEYFNQLEAEAKEKRIGFWSE